MALATVMGLVSVVLGAVAVVLLLPTLADVVSLAIPSAADDIPPPGDAKDQPRFLILIPAHDEELLIENCLRSLDALRYPSDRREILVVADNCRDNTARLVRSHGLTCLERTDAVQRGKPWAVAWALERVTVANYDAVIVLDADSIVDPGFLGALARRSPLDHKVVQGYIDVSNPEESPVTRMARVWSAVRFEVINRVKVRAALNVPLGDGVCIGSGVLREYGWSAFSLSETWEIYASMTAAGVRCVGAPDAHLAAQEARSLRQSASQRKRWTAGRVTVLRRYGWAVLTSPRIGVRQKLDCLAELTALGPAAHLGVALLLAGAAVLLPVPYGTPLAVGLLLSLGRPVIYTLIALAHDPAPGRAAAAFAFLPFYVVWRLWIQASSVTRWGEQPWERTGRHGPGEPLPMETKFDPEKRSPPPM